MTVNLQVATHFDRLFRVLEGPSEVIHSNSGGAPIAEALKSTGEFPASEMAEVNSSKACVNCPSLNRSFARALSSAARGENASSFATVFVCDGHVTTTSVLAVGRSQGMKIVRSEEHPSQH